MTASGDHAEAFTRIELMVVLAVIAVLVSSMILPVSNTGNGSKAKRIICVNNLRQIGIAYRIWASDNGDKFPSEVPQTNGGWSELLGSRNSGAYAWTNYLIMGNVLGHYSTVLMCPADERKPADNFTRLANTNISYFIGIGANDSHPQAILGGDRNLGPGNTPHDDYGFSPPDGKGNDVIVTGSVCWSLKMHSKGNSSGAGNIILGDGSVQQVTSGNLNLNWLKPSMEAYTNSTKGSVSSNGVRLIFP